MEKTLEQLKAEMEAADTAVDAATRRTYPTERKGDNAIRRAQRVYWAARDAYNAALAAKQGSK